jgi:hypothetical protein
MASSQLQPTDVYAHWEVTGLVQSTPGDVGLTAGSSTFRITHGSQSNHVLEKTHDVRWSGSPIPLTAVGSGTMEYQAGFRLKANVTKSGKHLRVFFGSQDGGKTLYFYIDELGPQRRNSRARNAARAVLIRTLVGRTHSGSFGTAGRGG